jgi:hypothetical protein
MPTFDDSTRRREKPSSSIGAKKPSTFSAKSGKFPFSLLQHQQPSTLLRRSFLTHLGQSHGNRFVQRLVHTSAVIQRGSPAKKPAVKLDHVTLTIKWGGKFGKDFQAEVIVTGDEDKQVAEGDGSGTEIRIKPARKNKYTITIIPSAAKPANYYSRTIIKKAVKLTLSDDKLTATATIAIPLKFNSKHRENKEFVEQVWKERKIDPVKAGDITTAKLFNKTIKVNKLVTSTVDQTNEYFNSKVPKDKQQEVLASIISIGGYNKRLTSAGTFSNHSTGCAVDINAFLPTKQNHHWKEKDGTKPATEAQLLNLVKEVVRGEKGWDRYDPWSEKQPGRILEASTLFNQRVHEFLRDALQEALPDEADSLKEQAIDEALLNRAVAAAAKNKLKSAATEWLKIALAHWKTIRAWTEGIVIYDYQHERWDYQSEYDKKQKAGKKIPKVQGTLKGMVTLHPTLVETMIAGGWSWLVDKAKDYMHFEDRKAYQGVKVAEEASKETTKK